jgi:hypothetical protein
MSKIAAKEGEKRPLPGSYSEMYPNRFLKADMLKGHKVTLTIKEIVGEGLMSDDGAANLEWVVSFKERPLQFVMNKTNAFCLYRMFGGDPHSWVGRKITLFPTTVKAFGSVQDCIRVWGSPELTEDIPITVPQGRKKAWEAVMHAVAGNGATAPKAASVAESTDPRILEAWGYLGWTEQERKESRTQLAALSDQEYLTILNAKLDAIAMKESA